MRSFFTARPFPDTCEDRVLLELKMQWVDLNLVNPLSAKVAVLRQVTLLTITGCIYKYCRIPSAELFH